MKKQEFYETLNSLEINQEVKVRYYTYNIKEYIDVIGTISDGYDRMDYSWAKAVSKCVIKGDDTPVLILESPEIVKFHDNCKDKNFPKLKGFYQDGKSYGYFGSSNIVFIKPISFRTYKIHKLINKKG